MGAMPDPEGTVTIGLLVGVGGEALGAGFGLILRTTWQLADDVQVGVDLGGGTGDPAGEAGAPKTRLLALRLFTKLNPGGADNLALLFGAGVGGATTGTRWLTLDGGMIAGTVVADTFEPHASVAMALSIPFVPGRPLLLDGAQELPTTTFYFGATAGAVVHIPSTDNALSFELGVYAARGVGARRATLYYLSLGDRQAFQP
jgi:hypothetical protein